MEYVTVGSGWDSIKRKPIQNQCIDPTIDRHNMKDIDLQSSYGEFNSDELYERLHKLVIDLHETLIVSTFRSFGYTMNTSWEFICNQSCIESETAKKIEMYVNEGLQVFYKRNSILTPVSISFPTKAINSANVEMYNMWKDMWVRAERNYDIMIRARDDDYAEF